MSRALELAAKAAETKSRADVSAAAEAANAELGDAADAIEILVDLAGVERLAVAFKMLNYELPYVHSSLADLEEWVTE